MFRKQRHAISVARCWITAAVCTASVCGLLLVARGPAQQPGGVALPTATQAHPAAMAESMGKVFTLQCPQGKASDVAAALKRQFASQPSVKIVPNPRTSQLLILAPLELQPQINDRFMQIVGPGVAAAAMASVPPTGAAPASGYTASQPVIASGSATRLLTLRHTKAVGIEAALTASFGRRLSPLPTSSAELAAYQLSLRDGSAIELVVDRANNSVRVRGAGPAADSLTQIIEVLDQPAQTAGASTQLVPVAAARPADLQKTIQALQMSNATPSGADETRLPIAAQMLRPATPEKPREGDTAVAQAPAPVAPPTKAVPGEAEGRGMIGPVQIEWIDGLDVLVIRGNPRDVAQVKAIIQQIEELAGKTEPAVEIYMLKHVDCRSMSLLLEQLYQQTYSARLGPVSIASLVKPNALLLVGRVEAVQKAIVLCKKFDTKVRPETQFQVFGLKWANATTVQTLLQQFYADRGGGLGPQVLAVADARANSIIVYAAPRDMAEVAELINRVDTDDTSSVNELRLFPLTHTLAEDLVTVLRDAVSGQGSSQSRTMAPAIQGMQPAFQAATGAGGTTGTQGGGRSAMLQMSTIDVQGHRKVSSGILSDVRFTPDARANTILVAAPAQSMSLIEALIKQLDQPPATRSEVKVFTILNSDAAALATMLDQLFGLGGANRQGGGSQGGFQGGFQGAASSIANLQTAAREGESSIIPLRFAVDERTNSLMATGAAGDLILVEAILLRLDSESTRGRQNLVYKLHNAPANDVANAVRQFLQQDRQVQNTGATSSPFEQIEREVVVVPEPVTNSLIISATPRFFKEVCQLVQDLDERPAMVVIQVLIAEIDLVNTDEFGVELGLQDSLLFKRSTALGPGFNFINQALGNSNSASSLATAPNVGAQGTSSFSLNRANNDFGFGGLVLSASSESVAILIRAMKENHRLDVLARPQITTLNNQQAFLQVGQKVPMIQSSTQSDFGQTNTIKETNVGVILRVTPRVAPDSMVVMEVDAERSDVGPEAEGIPIFVSSSGQTVRSPRINITTAQTTVSAVNGQTIILSGLIMKTKTESHRKVPYLGDVPVLGALFRYDATQIKRKELLIIMTPHVILKEQDAEVVKRTEAARINWCLADVVKIHGDGGLRSRQDDWSDSETPAIHPDRKPTVDPPKPPAPTELLPQPALTAPSTMAPEAPSPMGPEAPSPQSMPVPRVPQTDKPPVKATGPAAPQEGAPPLPQSSRPMALPRQQSSMPPLGIRRVASMASGTVWQDASDAAVPAAWQTPLPQRMVQQAAATDADPGFAPGAPLPYGEAVADDQNNLRLQR